MNKITKIVINTKTTDVHWWMQNDLIAWCVMCDQESTKLKKNLFNKIKHYNALSKKYSR